MDLILRLLLRIKAEPDIVNKKFTLFNGSERSFADLMQDDGQQSDYHRNIDKAIFLFRGIDPFLIPSLDDIFLFEEIFHKIRINCNGIQADEVTVPDCIATGISMTASALNHSCRPNAGIVFKGGNPQLRVIRDIVVEDEVTFSYCSINKLKAERCEPLAMNWGFKCKCERCEAGDQPDELEVMNRKKIAEMLMDSLSRHDKCNLMFEMMIKELPSREKHQGPFNPFLTDDMMLVVDLRLKSGKPFSEEDGKNMLVLMEKLMKAFPITHGTDHWKYPDILKMNEKVNQKFGQES
jgi:hypothetical protein